MLYRVRTVRSGGIHTGSTDVPFSPPAHGKQTIPRCQFHLQNAILIICTPIHPYLFCNKRQGAYKNARESWRLSARSRVQGAFPIKLLTIRSCTLVFMKVPFGGGSALPIYDLARISDLTLDFLAHLNGMCAVVTVPSISFVPSILETTSTRFYTHQPQLANATCTY